MAFKFVLLAAALACVNAGGLLSPALGPVGVAYSAAPAVSSISYSSPIVSYGSPLSSPIVTPAITSQSSNILRSYGNLGQISTYSKSIDTPFSSVRKADVRVSNPGLRYASVAAPFAYAAAPALTAVHHGPAIAAGQVGVGYSTAPALTAVHHGPAIAAGPVGVAYSAAPAVSHVTYSAPIVSYGF